MGKMNKLACPRFRLSTGALAATAFALFLAAGYACYFIFLVNIPDPRSGFQPDYLIDGYYYVYLADEVGRVFTNTSASFNDTVTDHQPNVSSFGVVWLSSVLLMVARSALVLPLICAIAIFTLCHKIVRGGSASRLIFLIPFTGLFPYYILPSKELFLLLAILVSILALRTRLMLRIPGLLLAFLLLWLSRPEALFIMFASIAIWVVRRQRWLLVLASGALLAVYFQYLREPIWTAATFFQEQMNQQELSFCNVGPLAVCMDSVGRSELVYFSRLLTLSILPLKWVLDFATVPLDLGTLKATEIITRGFSVAHLVAAGLIWRRIAPTHGRMRDLREILMIFAVVYFLIYGSILYFQPSRQALFASTFLLLSAVLTHPQGRRMLHRKMTPSADQPHSAGTTS